MTDIVRRFMRAHLTVNLNLHTVPISSQSTKQGSLSTLRLHYSDGVQGLRCRYL